MIYIIGSQKLGSTYVNNYQNEVLISPSGWYVKFFNKYGGLLSEYDLSQESGIESVEFELNKSISGTGKISFLYLDFPIDVDSYVEIYYQSHLIYSALVDIGLDVKGGECNLIPLLNRLETIQINPTFVNQTISEMLYTTITLIQSILGNGFINWNPWFISDIIDTSLYSIDFKDYSNAKDVLKKIIDNLDSDYQYGITSSRTFMVYLPNQVIDQSFFAGDESAYTKIVRKVNYEKIDQTRSIVFKKDEDIDGNEIEIKIGGVGFSDDPTDPLYDPTYPTLAIENIVGKKIGKYIISEYITDDADGLQMAYNELLAKSVTPESIDVQGFKLSSFWNYDKIIGKRIQVQDQECYQLRTILFCDSLTDDSDIENGIWYNCTLDSNDCVEGDASITFDNNSGEIRYEFNRMIRLHHPTKIGFMIKSDKQCTLDFSVSNFTSEFGENNIWSMGIWSLNNTTERLLFDESNTEKVFINTLNVWKFVSFNIPSTEFRSIGFRFSTTPSVTTTIHVDRIQTFLIHKPLFDAPICQMNVKIKSGLSEDVTLKLNDYDLKLNDRNFKDTKRISELEKIATSS